MTIAVLLLAWSAQAAPQPPIAVTNSPAPAVVSVPVHPPAAVRLVPYPVIVQPPPPSRRIVRAPQPRRPLASLVGAADYPASALAAGQQGTVAFTIDVGADGRVTACTITRSSGSAALDSATCRMVRARARFTPAADSNGNPAAGRVSDEIEWRLPPDQPERG